MRWNMHMRRQMGRDMRRRDRVGRDASGIGVVRRCGRLGVVEETPTHFMVVAMVMFWFRLTRRDHAFGRYGRAVESRVLARLRDRYPTIRSKVSKTCLA